MYVCLFLYYAIIALLRHYKDALEELEQSEIRTLLLRMPILDINEVIIQMHTIHTIHYPR
jgi:hypothetical protein